MPWDVVIAVVLQENTVSALPAPLAKEVAFALKRIKGRDVRSKVAVVLQLAKGLSVQACVHLCERDTLLTPLLIFAVGGIFATTPY